MESSPSEETKWFCVSSGYYRKGCPISAASFSEDGSLLALTYQSIITLWDVKHNVLLHTLSHPPSTTIKSVTFLPKTNFLLATLDTGFSVWNILNSTISWSIVSNVKTTCIDSSNVGHFAVVIASNEGEVNTGDSILIFSALSHIPLLSCKLPNGSLIETITCDSNTCRSSRTSSFILMLNNHELCQFGQNVSSKDDSNVEGNTLLSSHSINDELRKDLIASKLPSAFEQIFGVTPANSYDGKAVFLLITCVCVLFVLILYPTCL